MVLSDGFLTGKLLQQEVLFGVKSTTEIGRIESFNIEAALCERLLAAIRPSDVLFDVGANIGVISLLLGKKNFERGISVHAFEPEPRNAAQLRRNVQLNRLESIIKVHELALGKECGTIPMSVSGEEGEGSHSVIRSIGPASRLVQVPIDSMDNFSRKLSVIPTVVKVDVEGAEMDVLCGMERLLASGSIRDIFVEIHPSMLSSIGLNSECVERWVTKFGFQQIWIRQRQEQIHAHFSRMPA
jgi:FkbM family methyltransferase